MAICNENRSDSYKVELLELRAIGSNWRGNLCEALCHKIRLRNLSASLSLC